MMIYDIDPAMEQALVSCTDPETGELLDLSILDTLPMEEHAELENLALHYKNLTSFAQSIKEEEKKLAVRRKAIERNAERVKEWLAYCLQGEKLNTPRCVVTFRHTSSLQVDEPERLIGWAEDNGYDSCIRYQEPEISKPDVTKLIKSGVAVPGARLVSSLSMGVK